MSQWSRFAPLHAALLAFLCAAAPRAELLALPGLRRCGLPRFHSLCLRLCSSALPCRAPIALALAWLACAGVAPRCLAGFAPARLASDSACAPRRCRAASATSARRILPIRSIAG